MVKFDQVKLKYDSPCFPPDGIDMNKIYSITKKDKGLCITDGESEINMDEAVIKMLFVLQDKKLTWEDVDFSNKVAK